MEVRHIEKAKREAEVLSAEKYLFQAEQLLTDRQWQNLVSSNLVKPLKGGLKGVFEVCLCGYRIIFNLINENYALVFAFFKKEGQKLKRSELKTIHQRYKKVCLLK